MCIVCEHKNLDGLQSLNCSNCPLLTNIPMIEGLQSLNCSNCPLLTDIPMIEGLQYLYCSNCPLLTNIPMIEGLQYLYCSNCPLITNIPMIKGLQNLNCSNCPLLTNIPMIKGLRQLNCSNSRSLTELNINDTNTCVYRDGCVWLKNDPDFNKSMIKLIKLQQWFKSMYLSKRLNRLIPQLIPLYYHPDAKGGYFDKLKILNYFQEL
jgi:hypothetical protein